MSFPARLACFRRTSLPLAHPRAHCHRPSPRARTGAGMHDSIRMCGGTTPFSTAALMSVLVSFDQKRAASTSCVAAV